MTEGTFLEWLVDEGETVEEDQTVAEVETDKAVVDVPSPSQGTINDLKAEPGDTIEVGEVILEMDTGEGETGEAEDEKGTGELEEVEEEDEQSGGQEFTDSGAGDALALPKVRKLAEEKDVSLSKISGSGKNGRITGKDVKQAAGEEKVVREEENGTEETTEEEPVEEEKPVPVNVDVEATPAVRKLAREKGIDLTQIEGSGRGGKITREDVLDAEKGGKKTRRTKSVETGNGKVERKKMSGLEKTVADRMEQSKFSAPHVTHIDKADVTKLVELREKKKDHFDVHLTYMPFIMKAALVALKDYPELNAELDGEEDEILLKKHYDFNIAVDTDRGLMVPLIEDVDGKNIVELAGEIEEMVERVREGDASKEELRSGTFSITNIGAIGGRGFTPIINPPQVAILGIGKIEETPEVVNGSIEPRHTVQLSLSYDHRVVDGATAARFLNKLIENLEDPGELLMEMG